VPIYYYLALSQDLLMTRVLFVFGSKRGSSQSSAGTQVLVLPALEQAGTDIFSPHAESPMFGVGN
jgi:hypothetical protein